MKKVFRDTDLNGTIKNAEVSKEGQATARLFSHSFV